MNNKRSITRTNLLSWITTILLISGSFTTFFIYQKYKDLDEVSAILDEGHLKYSRNNQENEVSNVIKYLAFQDSLLKNKIAKDKANAKKLTEETKKQVLNDLKQIKFGRGTNGNIFILSSEGIVLMHPDGTEAENKNMNEWTNQDGRSPFKIIISLNKLKRRGETSFNVYNKLTKKNEKILLFSRTFNEWGWIVCSELNTNLVRNTIAQNRFKLQIDLMFEVAYICLLSIVITLIAIWFCYSVSQSLKKEINLLLNYFDKSASAEGELSEDEFQFKEFSFIAGSAIAMVDKIQSLIEKIKELALKAEANNQAKSTFLASINYGIRSPISGIMGMSQILSDTKLNDEQQKYVGSIVSSGRRIVELIDDVENFSSMEEGHLRITNEPFELSKTCDEVVEIMQKKAHDRNLKLEFHLAKDTPELLNGDSARIGQILTHLVENAIIFTTEGSVEIFINCLKEEDGKALIEFKVKDTGVGIDKESLDTIFNFTGKNFMPKSHKFSVVSLGLAVCKDMVELMGGQIEAESEEGKGSTFKFSIQLPIVSSDEIKGHEDKKEAAFEEKDKGKEVKTISGDKIKTLLVEDDPVNRSVASIFLTRAGCIVETAINGKDAVDKYKNGTFDLIFMDCEMPEMDGYDATKAIREMEPEGQHIPIVALTAHSLEGDRDRGMKAGMDDYLTKPFISSTLKKIIEKYVK